MITKTINVCRHGARYSVDVLGNLHCVVSVSHNMVNRVSSLSVIVGKQKAGYSETKKTE